MFFLRVCTATLLLAFFWQCSEQSPDTKAAAQSIVSLAPSITESLFALGLGDKVVGVTRYCRFPPAVDSIPEIGGYTDANLEKVLTLNPELVILLQDHQRQRLFLKRYGIETLTVEFGTVSAICSSLALIAKQCGATHSADSLLEHFKPLLSIDSTPSERPRILLCVGRDNPGGGRVQSVFAAGAGTFYNTIIEAAGGTNAYADTIPQYPRLSMEGIITIAPDIIIDVAPAMGYFSCSSLVADWNSVAMVPAVEKNQVYCLAADYATVPGPRVVTLFHDFQEMIGTGIK